MKTNREIKFRVWDNVDYMSTTFSLKDLQLRKVQFTDECEVMQFTGLKDKNGKEVFEGDVIKIHELPIKIRKVTFSNGMFKAEGTESITPLAWHGNAIEVIGNLYENPELCSTH